MTLPFDPLQLSLRFSGVISVGAKERLSGQNKESCGFLNCGLISSFVFAELVVHLA